MILRDPEYSDCEFIAECYEDWPASRKGRIFPTDVRDWINRYRYRDGEKGLVAELAGERIGFILFEQNLFVSVVYEIVVIRALRGAGHGSAMLRTLKDRFVSEGVVVCEFDALPGPIADKTLAGGFRKTGEGVGTRTGLPLVKGRVTADMDI